MKSLTIKSIFILVLVFFIGIAGIDETLSVYVSTFNPINGNINLSYPGTGEQNYPDVFYKVADTNDKIDVENGVDPSNMTGDADAFIPVPQEYNLADGYTYSVSVTTSQLGDFSGMGFYFYSYANPKNSNVNGISLQLTPDSLINKEQFVFIKKSYSSLSEDSDLSDGNNSILFVKEDFFKWDNIIKYPTTFANVTDRLIKDGKYDSKTIDFKVAVKQDETNKSKVKVQLTINDYCFGFFTITTDKLEISDTDSVLCVGAKTFHTGDKSYSFHNIKIGAHETFVPWRYQSELLARYQSATNI